MTSPTRAANRLSDNGAATIGGSRTQGGTWQSGTTTAMLEVHDSAFSGGAKIALN